MNILPFFLLFALEVLADSLVNDDEWIVTETEIVLDYRENPILKPTELLEWLLGDPTVVLIEETQEIHMFVNEVFHGILHFSADYSQPTDFTKQAEWRPLIGLDPLEILCSDLLRSRCCYASCLMIERTS